MQETVQAIEQELTYLAAFIPDELKNAAPTKLKDIYIPDTEGLHPQLRLRQKGDKYEMTKKTPVIEGDASAHEELTIQLDEKEFLALAKCSTKIVEKARFVININGYSAEVDVFTGSLQGLVLIEFEFADEVSKNSFIAPDVCLVDVTQEDFIAGGLLAGKSYADIRTELDRLGYHYLSM